MYSHFYLRKSIAADILRLQWGLEYNFKGRELQGYCEENGLWDKEFCKDWIIRIREVFTYFILHIDTNLRIHNSEHDDINIHKIWLQAVDANISV